MSSTMWGTGTVQLDNIKEPLPLGKSVAINVPTDNERTLTFQCGMGMYKSKVVVQ